MYTNTKPSNKVMPNHTWNGFLWPAFSAWCAMCTVTEEVTSKMVFHSGIPFQLMSITAALKVPLLAIICWPPEARTACCGVGIVEPQSETKPLHNSGLVNEP